MYNLERRLRYLHLSTRHCPCNLLPEHTSSKEYGGKLWGLPVTSSMTSSPWKYFFGIIWDGLFISKVKWKQCLIFQNGCHFQVATNFLPDVIPEVEYSSKLAMGISDILSFWSTLYLKYWDISISKFDVLCDLVTSPMTSWIRVYINVIIISWYLCPGSLMVISLLVF